jgi:polyferredoxin
MLVALSAKTVLDVTVQADRNPLFVTLSDGSVRNSFTVRILNKLYDTRAYALSIEGLPGAKLSVLGMDGDGNPKIEVAPDNLRTLKVFVTLPREAVKAVGRNEIPFVFAVRDVADGAASEQKTVFRGPSL